MIPQQVTPSDLSQTATLKQLAAASGPCVSLFVPWKDPADFRIRLAAAIREIEEELRTSYTGVDADELLQPLRSFEADPEGAAGHKALALFRSPGVFHQLWCTDIPLSASHVGEHFEIRPILAQRKNNEVFYIVTLNQKHARLLRCTDRSSEEISFPAGTATSMLAEEQTTQPDHDLQNHASGGPGTGSMKSVIFGSGVEKEVKDRHLLHFYRTIDDAIRLVLHDEIAKPNGAPLVPVGVEYELALYHQESRYPHLVPDGVHGAAESLKGGEMHKRALELLSSRVDQSVERTLAHFDKQVGSDHGSRNAREIVAAAFEGRISYLLIRNDASYLGDYDADRQRLHKHVESPAKAEDLLNVAASQTILHGGEVYLLSPEQMPNGVPVAALFRYASPEKTPVSQQG